MSIYSFEDTLDGVSMSVNDESKSEAGSVEGGMEPRASNDEDGVVHPMVCAELVEDHQRSDGGSRRKQADKREVIRLRIDRSEQPERSSLIQITVSSTAT